MIKKLAERYMREPEMLDFSPKTKSVETIEQFYFTVDQERKFDLLLRLIEREQPPQAIIFCRTKRGTDKIHIKLAKKFAGVDCIHGDMNQGMRDRVMKQFRAGEVKLLVATDVVGRGIDVTSISHIINYDVPASLRRLRASRRPHRPDGPRRGRLHVRHPRARGRADPHRRADQ